MNTTRAYNVRQLATILAGIGELDHKRIVARAEDLHTCLTILNKGHTKTWGLNIGPVDIRSTAVKLNAGLPDGMPGAFCARVERQDFTAALMGMVRSAEIQTEKDRRAGWEIVESGHAWVTFEILSGADKGLHLTLVEAAHSFPRVR